MMSLWTRTKTVTFFPNFLLGSISMYFVRFIIIYYLDSSQTRQVEQSKYEFRQLFFSKSRYVKHRRRKLHYRDQKKKNFTRGLSQLHSYQAFNSFLRLSRFICGKLRKVLSTLIETQKKKINEARCSKRCFFKPAKPI